MTDADGELYEHIEYFPFGETWVEEQANTIQRVPYRYTSKELDEETGLYYYGARYYDPRTSVWQSADPILGKYLPRAGESVEDIQAGSGGVFNPVSLALYSYSHLRPVILKDPDGNDAIPVVFPDYKISAIGTKWGGLGHAGIILINPKNGSTRYYEYGRYDKQNLGIVRRKTVPDVVMNKKTGKPTEASLKKLMAAVSRQSGHGTRIEGSYDKNDKFDKMNKYASKRMKANSDKTREPYDITDNNCATFAKDVLDAGDVDTPWMIDLRPNSYIDELQSTFDNSVNYNPAGKKLEIKNDG